MSVHIPILVETITGFLTENCKSEYWIIDATLGGGGHTSSFLQKGAKVIAVDRDVHAIEKAKTKFAEHIQNQNLILIHSSFSQIASVISQKIKNTENIVGILADLGFSSDQIEDEKRGLSFLKEGPLDMRLDTSQGETCAEFLSHVEESDLSDIIQNYGEERFARRIASAIISVRKTGQLPTTTKELSQIIVRAIPPRFRHGRIHAATRTFQALRMKVNEEVNELNAMLQNVQKILIPNGRIAVLTFHSIEDRMVKQAFKKPPFDAMSKKPIVPNREEILRNPRARSAKLRIAQLKVE